MRADTSADDSGTDGSGVQIFEAVASPPLLGDGYLQLFEQRSDLRSLARSVNTGRIISGTALIFAEGDEAVFPRTQSADGLSSARMTAWPRSRRAMRWPHSTPAR
ncbi:MAG: hypothetical protein R2854_07000 [Caldilineaceae bacterium]